MLRDNGMLQSQLWQARAPATKRTFLTYCVLAGKGCQCHAWVPLALERTFSYSYITGVFPQAQD